MLEELRRQQEETRSRILKSFGYDSDNIQKSEDNESLNDLIRKGEVEVNDELEKAVYADTAENRRLGRVGQEYHRGKGKSKDSFKIDSSVWGKTGLNEKHPAVKRLWELDDKIENKTATAKEKEEYFNLKQKIRDVKMGNKNSNNSPKKDVKNVTTSTEDNDDDFDVYDYVQDLHENELSIEGADDGYKYTTDDGKEYKVLHYSDEDKWGFVDDNGNVKKFRSQSKANDAFDKVVKPYIRKENNWK